MAAPNLTDNQRADILKRLAANEPKSAIAAAVGCSVDVVKYYARKRKTVVETIRERFAPQPTTMTTPTQDAKAAREEVAIIAGLHEGDARVQELVWLYSLVRADLASGVYGTDIKMSARGDVIEVPTFKTAQFTQARGALDDLAKETGGRKTNLKVDGNLNVHNTYADILAAAEANDGGIPDDHQT